MEYGGSDGEKITFSDIMFCYEKCLIFVSGLNPGDRYTMTIGRWEMTATADKNGEIQSDVSTYLQAEFEINEPYCATEKKVTFEIGGVTNKVTVVYGTRMIGADILTDRSVRYFPILGVGVYEYILPNREIWVRKDYDKYTQVTVEGDGVIKPVKELNDYLAEAVYRAELKQIWNAQETTFPNPPFDYTFSIGDYDEVITTFIIDNRSEGAEVVWLDHLGRWYTYLFQIGERSQSIETEGNNIEMEFGTHNNVFGSAGKVTTITHKLCQPMATREERLTLESLLRSSYVWMKTPQGYMPIVITTNTSKDTGGELVDFEFIVQTEKIKTQTR